MKPQPSVLRLRCPAQSRFVAALRHALASFLRAHDFEGQQLDDVTTAAGEALANIVEHAYAAAAAEVDRYIGMRANVDAKGTLALEVYDGGSFVKRRSPVLGRGFGLRIIRAIAARCTIDTSNGTHLRMIFERKR
jgi:anti-sigma regulatory factor (Ser/Thr protein kinase)